MCYAIPAKVTQIQDKVITVAYFDEERRARNDFYPDLRIGDYVYAQGGFIIRKVALKEAAAILETWKDVFFELKQKDESLTAKPLTLYQRANAARQKHLGNSCCVHGILEFSNYCQQNCFYCGIRKDNTTLTRYRMSVEEIIESARYAVEDLNFKALVLQSGEDLFYTQEILAEMVRKIMTGHPCLLILSIGERDIETYRALYAAGARGALLRFETSNPALYVRYRPGRILDERLNLIRQLRRMGYLVMTGFLVGLPQQTPEDILEDIKLATSLEPEMFSFGPFIPHPGTPLKETPKPDLDLMLTTIARVRISYPGSRILVTTAMESLDKQGLRRGLLSGGNSLMLNLTPEKYRRFYDIYPGHAQPAPAISSQIEAVLSLLGSIGRAPLDLGMDLC